MNKQEWIPTASKENLQQRANIMQQIRQFFAEREVLEVETPTISQHTITDPHIFPLTCNDQNNTYFLQTSPEYHMKRLLCADMGSIFQIGKAFRCDEQGRLHNPEFTMLEWYRLGFDHHALMDEMDLLLQTILYTTSAKRITYQEIFEQYCGIDPLIATVNELKAVAQQHNLNDPGLNDDKDAWLMYLFSLLIEPQLLKPIFVYNFPASQAVLARIDKDDPRVANRFEVYMGGMELANGFYELADAKEQRQRFENELAEKQSKVDYRLKLDENLLQALDHGLPDCAGVALGIDRLVMLALQADSIEKVIAFPFARA